jgi:hypothetical protein
MTHEQVAKLILSKGPDSKPSDYTTAELGAIRHHLRVCQECIETVEEQSAKINLSPMQLEEATVMAEEARIRIEQDPEAGEW